MDIPKATLKLIEKFSRKYNAEEKLKRLVQLVAKGSQGTKKVLLQG